MLHDIKYCITYRPLEGEIDPWGIPLIAEHKFLGITPLPQTPHSSPYDLAGGLREKYSKEKACILLPGTAFDRLGTRHGKGMGWYDRFLSRVPHEWLRIGITNRERLSPLPLIRQSWDEPVDWVIVQTPHGWEQIKTNARLF